MGMAGSGWGERTLAARRPRVCPRGVSIEDSARVISRMTDLVMIRTFGQEKIERFNGEIAQFLARWGEDIKAGDPYYNPNLSLETQNFSLKRL